jgi:hypothetical protein
MHKLGEFDIYDDGRPMKYIWINEVYRK